MIKEAFFLNYSDFEVIINSLEKGVNQAPYSNTELYFFIEKMLERSKHGVMTIKGKLSRKDYALFLKDIYKKMGHIIKKMENTSYKSLLNLLEKDAVFFYFFMRDIFPYIFMAGASPSVVERLVSYLYSLPTKKLAKVYKFLKRYVRRYASPSLILILMLLNNIDWDRWKDGSN